MAIPSLSYTEFKYRVMDTANPPAAKVITLDHLPTSEENIHVSFKDDFKKIDLKFTPNAALSYYEIRITKGETQTEAAEEYGIGKGIRLYHTTDLAAYTSQTVNIEFTNSQFPDGKNIPYVLGLYGKAQDSDGYWDVTYLLFTSDGKIYATSDYDGVETLTNQAIPES